MRELGVYSSGGGREHTKLRNQMERLFNAHVSLVYEDKRGKATVNSQIADSTVFWWNPQRPDQPSLWESKIELSEKFFNEIISHPVPLDMNTLRNGPTSPRCGKARSNSARSSSTRSSATRCRWT